MNYSYKDSGNTGVRVISGLSSEVKPVLNSTTDVEAEFYETDTRDVYEWDGANWVKTGSGGVELVSLSDSIAGEDLVNNKMAVEHQNGSFSAVRSTAAVALGSGGGAAGDYLERVILTSAVTTATLTISDGAGVVVASFLTTDPVGTVKEVSALAATSGFVVDLHASGVGTVTAIGRLT